MNNNQLFKIRIPLILTIVIVGLIVSFSLFVLFALSRVEKMTEEDSIGLMTAITGIDIPVELAALQETELYPAELVRVVDGDTIVVLLDGVETKVRLIGIDTPESVHPDENRNTEEGTSATAFTQATLAKYKTVYLQYDEERIDKYGRTLAYVWLSDNVTVYDEVDVKVYMLNAILIETGYAKAVSYPPNTFYDELFRSLENR